MQFRLILSLLLLVTPFSASASCADRARVIVVLEERYGERPRAREISEHGVVELFASLEGSWSVTLTTDDGQTCLIDSGSGLIGPHPSAGPFDTG